MQLTTEEKAAKWDAYISRCAKGGKKRQWTPAQLAQKRESLRATLDRKRAQIILTPSKA